MGQVAIKAPASLLGGSDVVTEYGPDKGLTDPAQQEQMPLAFNRRGANMPQLSKPVKLQTG